MDAVGTHARFPIAHAGALDHGGQALLLLQQLAPVALGIRATAEIDQARKRGEESSGSNVGGTEAVETTAQDRHQHRRRAGRQCDGE